jgi:hypothetical protein
VGRAVEGQIEANFKVLYRHSPGKIVEKYEKSVGTPVRPQIRHLPINVDCFKAHAQCSLRERTEEEWRKRG